MAKFYTVAEFEALVAERVKAPAVVKHPPMTTAERRAAVVRDSRKRQQVARTSLAVARVNGWKRPGMRSLAFAGEVR